MRIIGWDDYVMGITLVSSLIAASSTCTNGNKIFYSVYCACITKIDTVVCGQDSLTLEALELTINVRHFQGT